MTQPLLERLQDVIRTSKSFKEAWTFVYAADAQAVLDLVEAATGIERANAKAGSPERFGELADDHIGDLIAALARIRGNTEEARHEE